MNLPSYSDKEKIQRYTLATFYYSTNGDGWNSKDKWLSDADKCLWGLVSCTDSSAQSLSLGVNNLAGAIPAEIGLLTILSEFLIHCRLLPCPFPLRFSLILLLNISVLQRVWICMPIP